MCYALYKHYINILYNLYLDIINMIYIQILYIYVCVSGCNTVMATKYFT